MTTETPEIRSILDFLEQAGIEIVLEPIGEEAFLPGLAIRGGRLVVDLARLDWPGDLLHEAGHIAVTEPEERARLDSVRDDPAEEMAAIAWSYAAAVAIGLDPAILFHEGGYRGGAQALIDNFTSGRDVGVPMLEYYGMTAGRAATAAPGARPYPHMERWLR
ncbi:MAG TPA: hypothetical protein VF759_01650 [Allosphingosinicella sp.]|jgi:hypothetical protein